MGAEPFTPLNIIGWRGVSLSWLALGIAASHIPVLRELADEQAVPA